MLEVGRICVKIAGRDSGKKCVIVDIEGSKYVIDGQTRRRKVNGLHLEPIAEKVDLKKGASHDDVVKVLKALKIECKESKPRTSAPRPKRVRKAKVKTPKVKKAKTEVKTEKKSEPKEVKAEVKAEEKPKAEPKKEAKPAKEPEAKK